MENTGFVNRRIETPQHKTKTKTIWDIKKERREIIVLFNFFELDKYKLNDTLKNAKKESPPIFGERHIITIKKPTKKIFIDEMHGLLTEASNDLIEYFKREESTEHEKAFFYYNDMNFEFDTSKFNQLSEIEQQKKAKCFFMDIFNKISLNNESYNYLAQKNNRLVTLLWSIIRVTEYAHETSNIYFPHIDTNNSNNIKTENIYNNFMLEMNPSNTQVKIEAIKNFFDLLITTKERKEVYLNELHRHLEKTKNDSRIIDWIDRFINRDERLNSNSRVQILIWIWNHIKSKYYNNILPAWAASNDFKQDHIAINENIITFFDLMTNEAIKSSILSELKTSASKAKYRILSENKVHLNIPVSEETKLIFDSLKNHFNLSNEDLIKKLITLGNEKLKIYGVDV